MAVSRLEITSREPFADRASFGDAGPYERVNGVLHFAVDPAHPANAAIVDLDRAERSADGRVHFSADVCVLQPADPERGARRLVLDILNRGGKPINGAINLAKPPVAPTDAIDPGDGLLFRRGWSVAWCGWQWDVEPGAGVMTLRAPTALENGSPIAGEVAVRLQPAESVPACRLGHAIGVAAHKPYVAADVDDPAAVLTVRDGLDAPRQVIPREQWRFARDEDGRAVADPAWIRLEGGFERGRLYEVVYRTATCPVVGAGLLAVRDAAAFLRYGTAGEGNPSAGRIDHAYSFGVSQSGRFLRHFLYLGLNLDEQGRLVYDGVLPVVAGARRGEFNQRFGQPSITERPGFGHLPPFTDEPQATSANGATGEAGLLSRQRRLGGVPKVMYTNTAAEYWGFGGASLMHTDPAGERDVEPAPEARIYHFAGTQHSAGTLEFMHASLVFSPGGNPFNVVDYRPLTRAALVNLDRWASAGVEPPESQYPRFADGTAVPRETVLAQFAAIPGAALPAPAKLFESRRLDLGPDAAAGIGRYPPVSGEAYPAVVSAVDDDGNELAGIRLPDVAVPVATNTGWNPRRSDTGGDGETVLMAGSCLPFTATAAERQERDDPRPAIAERYASRAEYEARVRQATAQLVAERYVLAEDVELVVANALARYDAFAGVAERAVV
jgi:hypothetical protein